MCGPERPPFHASPVVRKGPISSKRVSSQDPLLRKFGNFILYSLNFAKILAHKNPNFEIFSLQASNLEIFSSQASKFGHFQFSSTLFQRQVSVRKPHTSEIQAAHPYLKKVECPPPPPEYITSYIQQGTSLYVAGYSFIQQGTPFSGYFFMAPGYFFISSKVLLSQGISLYSRVLYVTRILLYIQKWYLLMNIIF